MTEQSHFGGPKFEKIKTVTEQSHFERAGKAPAAHIPGKIKI